MTFSLFVMTSLPVVKMTILYRHAKHARYRQNDDTYNNTSNEQVKKQIGKEIF